MATPPYLSTRSSQPEDFGREYSETRSHGPFRQAKWCGTSSYRNPQDSEEPEVGAKSDEKRLERAAFQSRAEMGAARPPDLW